jgi:hypothetical protein
MPRGIRRLELPLTKLAADLTIPGAISQWKWEGTGQNGSIHARATDLVQQNAPSNGVTSITERWHIRPFQDLYQADFSSVPAQEFSQATMAFTATTAIVHLNNEVDV